MEVCLTHPYNFPKTRDTVNTGISTTKPLIIIIWQNLTCQSIRGHLRQKGQLDLSAKLLKSTGLSAEKIILTVKLKGQLIYLSASTQLSQERTQCISQYSMTTMCMFYFIISNNISWNVEGIENYAKEKWVNVSISQWAACWFASDFRSWPSTLHIEKGDFTHLRLFSQ